MYYGSISLVALLFSSKKEKVLLKKDQWRDRRRHIPRKTTE